MEPNWKMATWFCSPDDLPAVSLDVIDRRRLAICTTEVKRRSAFYVHRERLIAARWTWSPPSCWRIELIVGHAKHMSWASSDYFIRSHDRRTQFQLYSRASRVLSEVEFFLLLNEPGWHLVNP